MAQQNLEVAANWLLRALQSPQDAQAAVAEFWDPDGDYYPVRKFPESRPCHGLSEIAGFLVQFHEAWSHLEWEMQEVIEIGEDRVLVCGVMRGEGHVSGMNLGGDVFVCMWLRNGRLLRVEDHLTLSGALHAFGLEAETLEAARLRG